MTKPTKPAANEATPAPRAGPRPEARLPKGMRDIEAAELRQREEMLAKIREVYERYGFEPLETPAFEYTDALGKFLPDQDRPNEGVFSFQDVAPEARERGGTGQWLSLRYDLTAPLARYVAENYERLPKPFRRYAVGNVWRNEKPGPGRYREFLQFDADTVGAESVAADAEMCMLAADTMEALGLKGLYTVKISNRKVLDGIMEGIGIGGDANAQKRISVLRAIDKLERVGPAGVEALLVQGRLDESGDFTKGAGLAATQVKQIMELLQDWNVIVTYDDANQQITSITDVGSAPIGETNIAAIGRMRQVYEHVEIFQQGLDELQKIFELVERAGYRSDCIRIDSSVVRGLDYYTGPVFEADLTFEVKDDEGRPVRFGSVGGGGRYDDLVARFTGEKVPATGFSIGVSRLQAALAALDKSRASQADGPVVVLVMEKDRVAEYQKLVQTLRNADICAELYLGSAGMKAQMKYADRRSSPCVVIQGGDERAKSPPEVTLKDLIEGAKTAAAIKDHKEWKEARPAQVSVKEADLVSEVRKILARHSG